MVRIKTMLTGVAAIALTGLLSACGDPVGTPCEITGSGFHAKDPCAHQCLSRWSLTCPDGASVTPNVCTGTFECEPGGCPSGQACYHDDDPFDDRSFCVPQDVCGELSPGALAAWERASFERQLDVIRAREEKASRRKNATDVPVTPSAEAEPPQPIAQSVQAPITAAPVAATPALPCAATPDREAFFIQNNDAESGGPVVLAAGTRFERTLPYDWHFVLAPVEHGFAIRLFDRPVSELAVDLSAVTPPLRGPTNARALAGWHFRNADNTGPNTGDVNAPQELRLFQFAPSLTGAMGTVDFPAFVDAATGRGWLRIDHLELTPIKAGERASIETLSFQACLTWPRPADGEVQRWRRVRAAAAAAADANELDYSITDRELFGRCGLNFDAYALTALVKPRMLALDIDGDGSHDQVAQVTRLRDGRRGIALCRAGTWLEWVGDGHALAENEAVQSTVEALEAWRVYDSPNDATTFEGQPVWPPVDGQILTLERFEKSQVSLYWHDGKLGAHVAFRMIEP